LVTGIFGAEQRISDTVGRKALMFGHQVRVLTQCEPNIGVTEVVGRRGPTQFG